MMKPSFSQFIPLVLAIIVMAVIAVVITNAPKVPELQYIPVEHTGSDVIVSGQPSGAVAVIDEVTIKTPSFITVHESLSGAPAQLMGVSALLPPGAHTDIVINLSHETLPGYRYIVLLMEDNGNGVFDLGVDLPIMSDGVVVKRDFVADSKE